MSVPCTKIGFVNVITPPFPLVDGNLGEFKQQLEEMLKQGEIKLVIDFSRTQAIDSKGIEFLLDIYEDARKKGGNLKLCKLSELCSDIFAATRMNTFFDIYQEPEDAARSFL